MLAAAAHLLERDDLLLPTLLLSLPTCSGHKKNVEWKRWSKKAVCKSGDASGMSSIKEYTAEGKVHDDVVRMCMLVSICLDEQGTSAVLLRARCCAVPCVQPAGTSQPLEPARAAHIQVVAAAHETSKAHSSVWLHQP
jgi:hypothetical protein